MYSSIPGLFWTHTHLEEVMRITTVIERVQFVWWKITPNRLPWQNSYSLFTFITVSKTGSMSFAMNDPPLIFSYLFSDSCRRFLEFHIQLQVTGWKLLIECGMYNIPFYGSHSSSFTQSIMEPDLATTIFLVTGLLMLTSS